MSILIHWQILIISIQDGRTPGRKERLGGIRVQKGKVLNRQGWECPAPGLYEAREII